MSLRNLTYSILLVIFIVIILVVGKDLLIPLFLALIFWFLIKEIRAQIKKIPVIGSKMPNWLLSLSAIGLIFILAAFVIDILLINIQSLTQNLNTYEKNIEVLNQELIAKFDINMRTLWTKYVGEFNFSSVIKDIVNSITSMFSNTFMIVLYVMFLMFEEQLFPNKLRAIYKNEGEFETVQKTLKRVNRTISKYITLKTLVSLITGVCSYIALYFLGIDSPVFWAFLIFLLNFIPTIGSLIATLFPSIIAILQTGDFQLFLMVLLIVGAIQVLVGNIIEPRVMGNSLNVSTLVVFMSLTFWGTIWGITGMVLSVPITVILIILFSQFDSTKNLAILLSEKGNITKE